MVITGEDCGRATMKEGHSWVFWFGDHKVSQVLCWLLLDDFYNFFSHFPHIQFPFRLWSTRVCSLTVWTVLSMRELKRRFQSRMTSRNVAVELAISRSLLMKSLPGPKFLKVLRKISGRFHLERRQILEAS